ncbi:hypothetical protein BC830DRAFT_578439 [Chytriomyces sp. MP71]|nr:hypothetical protein BC830DRAFT_578439 [Chytriomyces sp. MP71]
MPPHSLAALRRKHAHPIASLDAALHVPSHKHRFLGTIALADEEEEEFTQLDARAAAQGDLEVSLEDGILTAQGHAKKSPERTNYITRSIAIPDNIVGDKVNATMSKGVLTMEFYKNDDLEDEEEDDMEDDDDEMDDGDDVDEEENEVEEVEVFEADDDAEAEEDEDDDSEEVEFNEGDEIIYEPAAAYEEEADDQDLEEDDVVEEADFGVYFA